MTERNLGPTGRTNSMSVTKELMGQIGIYDRMTDTPADVMVRIQTAKRIAELAPMLVTEAAARREKMLKELGVGELVV